MLVELHPPHTPYLAIRNVSKGPKLPSAENHSLQDPTGIPDTWGSYMIYRSLSIVIPKPPVPNGNSLCSLVFSEKGNKEKIINFFIVKNNKKVINLT